jgi:hypothetical protein
MRKIKTPSVFVFFATVIFTLVTYKFWINWWDNAPLINDVDQYYSYLVAKFIHNDFNFNFPNHYWLVPSPSGVAVPKVTMGMAYLYCPFFIIGNNIAYAHDFEGLGYSAPYMWSIHFGSIFYALLGVWYSRKSLLLFFNEWITAASIVLILFGTNLFYYTYKESEMVHGYLFFLFSVFIYHVLQWRKSGKTKYVYYFSFIAGLATIIRPTEILILLFPLLIYVSTFSDLKQRWKEIIALKWKLLIAIILFSIPIIPQLIFWKIQTGQFFFFSYGSEEGFFFADPQFFNVLFSWRKGWFTYTPLMIFAIIGLILMFFKWRKFAMPIVIYFCLNLYLISSWWDWGYGGSYGMRALVQTYAFLIFPLAFFIKWLFIDLKKKFLKIVLGTVFIACSLFFCYLTAFQTYLFKNHLMHWDGMTKEAYWNTFLQPKVDMVYQETLYKSPNYEEMRKGNRDE